MEEQRKGYTGYRYSKVGDDIFVTRLTCYNEFANPLYPAFPVDFFTDDCVVEEIRNADTNKRYRWIKGKAWFPFRFEVGQRIQGTSIYYCKTRAALCLGYLYRSSVTGKIQDNLSNLFGLFRKEIMPGLNYMAYSVMKAAGGDVDLMFEDINALLLGAEKKTFPDEKRTLEEVMHTDPLTFDHVPPELKLQPDYTMEQCLESWKEFRKTSDLDLTFNKVGAAR